MDIKIVNKRTDRLVPYARNAKTHPEAQIEQIARSIEEFGFVNPVLVQGDFTIIAGHGRVLAAQKLGMKEVPCIVLSHLSERQARALVLADNRIQLNSGWDLEKLSEELSALAEQDFDLSITGFDEQELDALLKADAGVLPESWQSDLLNTEGGRAEPTKQQGELQQVRPRSSDDEHSTFELVMKHQNKVRLVEVLSGIRNEYALQLLEDALMVLVDKYEQNGK